VQRRKILDTPKELCRCRHKKEIRKGEAAVGRKWPLWHLSEKKKGIRRTYRFPQARVTSAAGGSGRYKKGVPAASYLIGGNGKATQTLSVTNRSPLRGLLSGEERSSHMMREWWVGVLRLDGTDAKVRKFLKGGEAL